MKATPQTAFEEAWTAIFSSPVHLDAALSKLPRELKGAVALSLPKILRQPLSLAEALGVGMPSGEPWNLRNQPEALQAWRPARALFQRLSAFHEGAATPVDACPEDFPREFLDAWKKSWPGKGSAFFSALARSLAGEPPLTLRVNRTFLPEKQKAPFSRDLLSERLSQSSGVSAEPTLLSPQGLSFSKYAAVLSSPEYEQGAFEIQDEGSQILAFFSLWPEQFAPLLQKEPGPCPPLYRGNSSAKALGELPAPERLSQLRVIDACAGAGGKTLALADALKGKGRIFAYDVSLRKLQALKRRASRASFRNIQPLQIQPGTVEKLIQSFPSSADLVLVDAPCSGWGVLRRNPDIKWRQKAEELTRLPQLQYELLSGYAPLVAPRGRLVYGTCTFRREETEEVVERFLGNHPEFEKREGGYLGPSPCDGFFMQAFSRKQ